MKSEQIKQRINDALEAELGKIYDELQIKTGDISPLDFLEWDRLTDELTTLFQTLIAWNADEE